MWGGGEGKSNATDGTVGLLLQPLTSMLVGEMAISTVHMNNDCLEHPLPDQSA